MPFLVIVTALALIVYMGVSLRVGMARGKFDIAAPATTGNEIFERIYRVQQNTLEQLIVFLPAIWIFGTQLNATVAAGLGLVFVIGRILYAISYVADPKKRTAGFLIGYLANVLLVIGSLVSGFKMLA